jgi:integrase
MPRTPAGRFETDPIAAREAASEARKARRTFGEVAEEHINAMTPKWKSPLTAKNWRSTLKRYCGPILNMPIDEVGVHDVLKCLAPVWEKQPPMATQLRGRLEQIFDCAEASGLRTEKNPASWRGNLKHKLPHLYGRANQKHRPALPYDEVPAFVAQLATVDDRVAAAALEFCILSAARSGEVFAAKWEEIDLDTKVWTVPASRMKARQEHRVPLCNRAVEILENMRALIGGTISTSRGETPISGEYVFPGSQARCRHVAADGMLRLLLRNLHPTATVHWFRSSFRDWCGNDAEQALAHATGNATELAYRRSDALERRRPLMEAWASYCEPGTVIAVNFRATGN